MDFEVLIIGAGHAGARAAISLWAAGFEGSIGLLGDEPDSPYERPPLFKEYLAAEKSFERLKIIWGAYADADRGVGPPERGTP